MVCFISLKSSIIFSARGEHSLYNANMTCLKHILFIFLISSACSSEQDDGTLGKAYTKYQQGDLDGAIKLYEEGYNKNKTSPEYLLRYGNALEDNVEIPKAKELYNAGLKINPKHILLHVNLASALRKEGNFKEAIAHMEIAVKLKPGEAWLMDNLGNIYQDNGDIEKALFSYRKTVEMEPNDPEFLTDLANAELKLGHKKEALVAYRKLSALLVGIGEGGGDRDYPKQKAFSDSMIQILTKELN